jgi:phosphate-selective porin OprO/OprP
MRAMNAHIRHMAVIYVLTAASCALAVALTSSSALAQPGPADDPDARPERDVPFEFKGFEIRPADGYVLKLGALIHGDAAFFLADEAEAYEDEFRLRRARPRLRGTIHKYFDFDFTPEFGDGNLRLLDAWIDIHLVDEIRPHLGKMKAPFGLERLQSSSALHLIEESLVGNLVPNRDIGAALFGEVLDGVLEYQVGAYDGTPDGESIDRNAEDGFDVVGRVFSHPFRTFESKWLDNLGLGSALSWGETQGDDEATQLPGYQSSGRATIFEYLTSDTLGPVVADGTRFRITGQAYYYGGPIGAMFEYVRSSHEVALAGARSTFHHQGWQVTLNLVPTLEDASYKGVDPARPLDLETGGFGAFELAVRYHELDIDEAAFILGFADPTESVGRARGFSGGVAWHLNRNIKLQSSYDNTTFFGGNGNEDRPTEHALLNRVQLSL